MSDEKNHSVEQPDRKGEVYERRADEPGSVPAEKEGSEGGYGGQRQTREAPTPPEPN